MTAVKFCGLTREEDVREAVRLGVDFIGLNFVPESPRCVTAERAAALVEAGRALPATVRFVGVFARGGPLDEVLRRCPLDVLQWHSAPGSCPASGLPVIQALRLHPGDKPPDPLPPGPWAYLVDAYHDRLLGGTGQTADWEVAAELAPTYRLFLAGGLRPDNVGAAIAAVHPDAVDVAGGIEVSPGIKDHALMRSFIEEVRRADAIR